MTMEPVKPEGAEIRTPTYVGPERRRYDRRLGVPDAAWSYGDLLADDRREQGRRSADRITPTSREELLGIARRVLWKDNEKVS